MSIFKRSPQDEESKGEEQEQGGEDLTLTAHLIELRVRLTRSVIAAILGMIACYAFAQGILNILIAPMKPYMPPGSTLTYSSLPEMFLTELKVALVAGIFLTSPYIFYQIWLFVAPGLYKDERKYLWPIAIASAFCFTVGAMFGYFVVFPFGFKFFLGFAEKYDVPALIRYSEYLTFALKLLIAFGVAFELPLAIYFLARLGLVTDKFLQKSRKFAILIVFIFSAALTPPDVLSQLFMAGPMILLYEISIWVAKVVGKDKAQESEEAEEEESDAS